MLHPVFSVAFQFYDLFEIGIRQCRSSGIDCKIHGLSIVGHRRTEDEEIITGYSYLASDKVSGSCHAEVGWEWGGEGEDDWVKLAVQLREVAVQSIQLTETGGWGVGGGGGGDLGKKMMREGQ